MSAAILKILDLKIFDKNIQRFIAFNLIFHLVYFFNGLRTPDFAKNTVKNFFRLFLQFSETYILDRTIIFWDFKFRIEVKVVIRCI